MLQYWFKLIVLACISVNIACLVSWYLLMLQLFLFWISLVHLFTKFSILIGYTSVIFVYFNWLVSLSIFCFHSDMFSQPYLHLLVSHCSTFSYMLAGLGQWYCSSFGNHFDYLFRHFTSIAQKQSLFYVWKLAFCFLILQRLLM